ncbi:phage uncharacterized protein [Ancylobacter novellus DSM 506]|uniref:Phage uncharacterized protein n=1 Tax=Ancylobacter novellus (strain ATCC 8093 / DSM 506 / JCM 20403 / CCM 1077 / IAM 12100 / NBRC 12443 / NCIMB 10456) TaxID=639283 RepID=D7A2P5_ANCN5|nr:phage terminase large subunit [Ancylobacter novellus]ADH91575.1 phage uncharacterized protein [Ancylobacter novellus DSM 506]
MRDEARLLRAFLRRDLCAFMEKVFAELEPGTVYQPNWHLEHLAYMLSRVASGEIRRLIINVPPRSGKSLLASVAFPMWWLGHDPTRRIICVSHTESLARKFSQDRRLVAECAWFWRAFPRFRLDGRGQRSLELITDLRGSIFAAGVGGAILGRGADLMIADDPLKGMDALSSAKRNSLNDFFDNTLVTRLNDKKTGAIIIIMQRLHEDDLVGHVLRKEGWEVVSLPAIATEAGSFALGSDPRDKYVRRIGEVLDANREPLEVLEALRRTQGSLIFSAQYQQNPIPAEGNLVRREWLRRYDRPPSFDRLVVSWDTASTLGEASDWSVGTVWGARGVDFYLIDVVRGRFESPELRRQILALHRRYEADATLIEDTELGRAMEQDLRSTGELRALKMRPRFDKEARFLAQSARFEAGQVHVPEEAPWLADYISELLAFPNGRHDDQVDSTSQALHYLTLSTARERELIRREIPRRSITRRS